MAKKEILSKLNLKDYNNELEEILEKKAFSSQVKNLLLSMFYKLEVGYKDYSIVKRDVISKESFMESLMYIIKEKCHAIELIKPKEEEEEKFFVYPEEGKILCYQNEAILLHALLEMGNKEFLISDNNQVWKRAIQSVLKQGYELDITELLTNFDGWAWNNNMDKTDCFDCYVVYQNLRLLMGNAFLYNWKRDRRKGKEYLEEIQKRSNEFWQAFCQFCLIQASYDKEEKKYIQEKLQEVKEELSQMENKKEFVKGIYEQKKFVSGQIKRIEQIINDNELLKEEFLSRNAELTAEKKIFSISDLEELLQKEKKTCMTKLQEYNAILEPKNYLKKMKQLEETIALVESVEISEITEKSLEEKQIELQKTFLEIFQERIAKSTTKKEMIEFVYQYRYYSYLPLQRDGKVIPLKEIPELKEKIAEIAKKVITQACKLKALVIINQDISYNFQILQKVLDTKMVHLEDIYVTLSSTEEDIHIEVYDGEILDRTESVPKEKEQDFAIKFHKKIKLFA